MKPEYRIRVEIYDETTSEVVTKEDQPLMSNDIDNVANAHRALRRFKKDDQTAHELIHYPNEKEYE